MDAKIWFDEFWRQVFRLALSLFVAGLVAWGFFFVLMYAMYKGWIGP